MRAGDCQTFACTPRIANRLLRACATTPMFVPMAMHARSGDAALTMLDVDSRGWR